MHDDESRNKMASGGKFKLEKFVAADVRNDPHSRWLFVERFKIDSLQLFHDYVYIRAD